MNETVFILFVKMIIGKKNFIIDHQYNDFQKICYAGQKGIEQMQRYIERKANNL